MSSDKDRILELAEKGHELKTEKVLVKDPFVLEFLNIKENTEYLESDLGKNSDYCHINALISSALSFSISTIVNYLISVVWVFKVNKETSKKNFIIFIIGSIIGLVLTELIMYGI